jgi:hypothetical protein
MVLREIRREDVDWMELAQGWNYGNMVTKIVVP